MIKLDSYCTIGKTHQVCQDYVIHREGPVPHIILGDGCSSSPDTDVGVRIWVHIAKDMIKNTMTRGLQYFIPEGIVFWMTSMAKRVLPTLDLTSQNLDSTLMILCKDIDKNIARLLMMGDGIVISKTKGKSPHIVKVSYMEEMPYYLSYSLDENRNKAYNLKAKQLESEGMTKIIGNLSGCEKAPYYDLTSIEYDLDDLEYIIVSSDGLDSFYQQETGEKIPVEMTAALLDQFKSFKGEFLKRRIKRILKDYKKQGIHHYDDLSLGIMYNESKGGKKGSV
jgi:hypothetical protein